MKRFDVIRKVKYVYLFLPLVMLAMAGGLAYLFFMLYSGLGITSLLGNSPSPIPIVLGLACFFPIFLFILFAIWMGLLWLALQRTCLVFEDTTLRQESSSHLSFLFFQRGFKPFSVDYDQIKEIRNGRMRGSLQILDHEGKAVDLIPSLFGNNYGEDILLELQKHVTSEQFESGMDIPTVLKKWQAESRKKIIIPLVFLILYLATFSLDPQFSSRLWLKVPWKTELHLPLFESPWTYTLISQDETWLISNKISSFSAYHYSSGKVVDTWDFKTPAGQYPDFVSTDNKGNPIIWYEDSVLHYDKTWKTLKYKNDLNVSGWYSSGLVRGTQGWAIRKIGEKNQFIRIDGLTGEWTVLPLPNSAVQQNLYPQRMLQTTAGDYLVLMNNNDIARIYLFSAGTWKPLEFSVNVPEINQLNSFFLDSKNSLWVLFSSEGYWFVEKIPLSGETLLTQLPSPIGEPHMERYMNLFVDTHGRIWVTGGYPYFISVFNPVWKGEASEIIKYKEKNSNYQGGGLQPPVMTSDGKLWTFDQRIVTMDTNIETLPAPLPDWFAKLDWNIIRLVLITSQMAFSVIIYISTIRWIYPKRSKISK